MPHNYLPNCVVYTGSHDNDTVGGWFDHAPKADVALCREYFGLNCNCHGNWAFIRGALGSVVTLAVVPIQNYLNLGSEAHINIPAMLGGNNWRRRVSEQDLTRPCRTHFQIDCSLWSIPKNEWRRRCQ